MTATQAFGTLQAPASWQTVDLISDLHLQASETATFAAWRDHMVRTQADAVLILGDLFEVWVGDDAVASDPFLQQCAEVLKQTAQHRAVYFMPGNRDFLVGPAFLGACGVQALPDPTVLVWGERRTVLTHGDALCLDDEAYQRFRLQARDPAWQAAFLARPLSERLALAQSMREQSKAHNQNVAYFADADAAMTQAWLQAAQSAHMVHGHTHQPADHAIPAPSAALRQVLSDWALDHGAPRAEVLRLHADGSHQRTLPLHARP
ncbi:UDP-2,3-diacylglucosamine diphosphatase [Limnohabitans radicicola]|uniref:UDP-2,3-diacylglucosamine hydrolase n=1 Tax=Limnohabitans radicicola TaxID=2771427 RepID=A0A927FFS6_9BURK|nr:UDP-2,3-diacylglucosamine diphosphatase [Limnohabitans radicicola]MBD8050625.1 UDP-2,3-diacylglucosamine diphosphatase [Limnohabitans radicicola]